MELRQMRRLAACTLVVGALAPAAAGAASACDGGHNGNNGVKAASFTMNKHADFGYGLKSQLLSVASSYLGLSTDTIKADLKSGQSLGQIADATAGHSSAGLVSAYVSALQTKLDAWVAAGKLTTAKEADILQKSQPWFQKLVDAKWTRHHSHHKWAFAKRH